MKNAEARPLFETPDGTVRHCACCGRVQITFQEEVLLLDVPTFQDLARTVKRAAAQVEATDTGWWQLAARADAGERHVLVCAEEFLAFRDLISGAAAMLELHHLLADVLNP